MSKEEIKKQYEEISAKIQEMGDNATDELREKRDELKAKLDEMTD